MKFYDNYVALCNKFGKTPSAVAIEIGLSKPAVHRWKHGGDPTDATARKVAAYFGMTVDELRKGFVNEKPADQKTDGLRGAGYYELNDENRAVIDSLIEKLLKSQSGE